MMVLNSKYHGIVDLDWEFEFKDLFVDEILFCSRTFLLSIRIPSSNINLLELWQILKNKSGSITGIADTRIILAGNPMKQWLLSHSVI